MSTYPTSRDKTNDPQRAIDTLEQINRELQQAINDGLTREADLREAIQLSVAAIDMASHASVMLARGVCNTGVMPTHAHIQNLLALALSHIRQTTGIELGPQA